jgi:hypothetical protein
MTSLIPRSPRQFFAAFVVGLSFIAHGFRD